MRRHLVALALALVLGSASLAPAAGPLPKNAASLEDVQEYIRLFGYREMLEHSAERQLDAIVEAARRERPDVADGTFAIIRQEMGAEMRAASERAAREMAEVFQRRLTRDDVAYLLGVGRDARMQRVIKLQPRIAEDLEGIGERLAEDITGRAAPRIMERLNRPQQDDSEESEKPDRQTL